MNFKNMLLTYAEDMVMDHKRRLRRKHLDTINFKLHGDEKYRVKNDFFEFQIENQVSQLDPKSI